MAAVGGFRDTVVRPVTVWGTPAPRLWRVRRPCRRSGRLLVAVLAYLLVALEAVVRAFGFAAAIGDPVRLLPAHRTAGQPPGARASIRMRVVTSPLTQFPEDDNQ